MSETERPRFSRFRARFSCRNRIRLSPAPGRDEPCKKLRRDSSVLRMNAEGQKDSPRAEAAYDSARGIVRPAELSRTAGLPARVRFDSVLNKAVV